MIFIAQLICSSIQKFNVLIFYLYDYHPEIIPSTNNFSPFGFFPKSVLQM